MFRKLSCFLLWQSALCGFVLAQDKVAPTSSTLSLRAEQGEIDFAQGIATYTGKVEIAQEGLKVTGDKVVAKMGDGEQLHIVEASGSPATFRYKPPKEPEIYGEGKSLRYDVKQQILTIEGNAKIRQGEHQTTAQQLSYDIKREKLRSQKVHIIYQVPQK